MVGKAIDGSDGVDRYLKLKIWQRSAFPFSLYTSYNIPRLSLASRNNAIGRLGAIEWIGGRTTREGQVEAPIRVFGIDFRDSILQKTGQ